MFKLDDVVESIHGIGVITSIEPGITGTLYEIDHKFQLTFEELMLLTDAKVSKGSGKPFKSGQKVNTIKGLIKHSILNKPSFTFREDDSYVDCDSCVLES